MDDDRRRTWWRRGAWLLALWALGVAAVGVVTALVKWSMQAAGLYG
jgi:hypothetical protein